jgi:hypothetical protein
VPELLDGIVEDINWIEAFVEINRPCKKHVKPIALLRVLGRAPNGINLGERRRCSVSL